MPTGSKSERPGLMMCAQESHLQLNHAVEIIGKVQNDMSVKVMASTDFGPENDVGMCLVVLWICVGS